MNDIIRDAELKDLVRDYRRYLHQNAETGFDLPKSSSFIQSELKKMGYSPRELCKCGILAEVGDAGKGKVILLRADYDALPITEEADVPYQATNGNMHACGHDMHAAMLLVAAKVLKEREVELRGMVKLMFQPAEEIGEGAEAMLEAGLLENPKVDAAAMIHVFVGSPHETGTLVIPEADGGFMASSDTFEITVTGKGGHGAATHSTIDPINSAAHIHLALQALNSREVSPLDSIALSIGSFNSGSVANIIPDTATLKGTLRTFDENTREHAKKRITEISESMAKLFGACAVVTIQEGCPALKINADFASEAREVLTEVLPDGFVKEPFGPGGGKTMGSDDFSFISQKIPSTTLHLMCGQPKDGYTYPQHNPKVIFDENALIWGVAIYAELATKWLRINRD